MKKFCQALRLNIFIICAINSNVEGKPEITTTEMPTTLEMTEKTLPEHVEGKPEITTTEMPTTLEMTEKTLPEHSTHSIGSEHTTSDGDYHDNFEESLTADSYMHLTNSTGENITEAEIEKQNNIVSNYISWEPNKNIRHFADFTSYMRTCYYLATTYKNAMRDIRKYYQIRYLYVKTKEYEIAYVTQEIVYKYQIVLELFHLIQRKFYQNQHRQYAPTTYMLYIYTNILHQCKDIMHLCNMLHEIEKKYRREPAGGAWHDADEVKNSGNKTYQEKLDAIRAYQKKRERMERKRARERKKRMKELQKGVLFKTTRFTTRRTKLHWDLHYGWSIEYW